MAGEGVADICHDHHTRFSLTPTPMKHCRLFLLLSLGLQVSYFKRGISGAFKHSICQQSCKVHVLMHHSNCPFFLNCNEVGSLPLKKKITPRCSLPLRFRSVAFSNGPNTKLRFPVTALFASSGMWVRPGLTTVSGRTWRRSTGWRPGTTKIIIPNDQRIPQFFSLLLFCCNYFFLPSSFYKTGFWTAI